MNLKKIIYKNSAFIAILCFINVFSATLIVKAATPLEPWKWNKTSISCFISTSVSSNYGSTVYNNIVSGLKNWNSTDAPDITITNSTSSLAPITVGMGSYGATGWDGSTTTTYSGGITSKAIMSLNTYYLSGYLSVGGLWKAIATHEMGHALGLNHNTTVAENSIMKVYTVGYYNYAGTSPKLTAPTSVDITAMNSRY